MAPMFLASATSKIELQFPRMENCESGLDTSTLTPHRSLKSPLLEKRSLWGTKSFVYLICRPTILLKMFAKKLSKDSGSQEVNINSSRRTRESECIMTEDMHFNTYSHNLGWDVWLSQLHMQHWALLQADLTHTRLFSWTSVENSRKR